MLFRSLAGHALQTGETINIADAYTDPRFIRRMDIETGYQTRSVLSMPVIARDGRRLGVMQALNHHGSQQFSSEDAAKMSAFAAQAAIAIDNATLFSEVVSSRNYNENILRSMSSGVITLDCDDLIIKINEAAAAIFGVRAESVQGTDLRAFLMHANPQSIARIDEVIESGQSKTLFDIDITTAEGAVVSANVSIVPLMSDGARQGLMILIEDISQGKRLEGAMRRFMTQNVVDQVLGREDELLFGTACRASILFADIRNFTSMAEDLPPRATVDMLNEIFTELFEAVAGQGGVLDKYIGDALMAVYGAPISTANDPANAVASAIQMQAMIDTINVGRRAQGAAELRLGIGIASGDVVAGTIGSPKRMDYTVIGDSVNLAARLEAATKFYGIDIIICEHTAALCGTMHLRQLDLIRVRGRHEPSKIFQVLTQSLSGSGLSADMITAYEQGRTHLERRRWDDAIAAFETALIHDPNDQPCAIMLRRARILAATPPGDEWDGIWHSPGTIRPV